MYAIYGVTFTTNKNSVMLAFGYHTYGSYGIVYPVVNGGRELRSELGVFTFTFEIVPILYGEPFGATNGVSEASDSNTVGYNSYNMGRPSDVNVDVNVGF